MDKSGRIVGIVLAAGKSQRMGEFKPLMQIAGMPMLQRVIENAKEGGLEPLIVVSGFAAERVREIIARCGASEVYNGDFEDGMLSSVKVGVTALAEAGAFMIVLGDQPGVMPRTYRRIVEVWKESGARVVVPKFEGRKGHPVLFDRECAKEILELQAGQTLRDVVERGAQEVEVDDPGVLADVDTQDDYQAEVRRLAT
jgi:molybdenum cofactor cytidylyltransferase